MSTVGRDDEAPKDRGRSNGTEPRDPAMYETRDPKQLQRSCSFYGARANPIGAIFFLLVGVFAVTVVVPAVVVGGNEGLQEGIFVGVAATAVWVAVAVWFSILGKRAVRRERAWLAELPFSVTASYWDLLQAPPHVYYTQGSEGTNTNHILSRYVRLHFFTGPEHAEALAAWFHEVLPSDVAVAFSPAGQVALTNELRCREDARPARSWLHAVIEKLLLEPEGAHRVERVEVSWTRSYVAERARQSVEPLRDPEEKKPFRRSGPTKV